MGDGGDHVGAVLQRNSRVELVGIPESSSRAERALVEMNASTICGIDPAGRMVATGPGMRQFREGDRAFMYHVSGCGRHHECLTGCQTGCTSPLRAPYGWQRDRGNAEDLVERMPRWGMHPHVTCTHRFPLARASEAYRTMDEGKSGKVATVSKVAIVFDEELES